MARPPGASEAPGGPPARSVGLPGAFGESPARGHKAEQKGLPPKEINWPPSRGVSRGRATPSEEGLYSPPEPASDWPMSTATWPSDFFGRHPPKMASIRCATQALHCIWIGAMSLSLAVSAGFRTCFDGRSGLCSSNKLQCENPPLGTLTCCSQHHLHHHHHHTHSTGGSVHFKERAKSRAGEGGSTLPIRRRLSASSDFDGARFPKAVSVRIHPIRAWSGIRRKPHVNLLRSSRRRRND